MQKIRKQLAQTLGVPQSAIMNIPVVTVQGMSSMYIENYKSISLYTDTELVVVAKHMVISVSGESLRVELITSEVLTVSGIFQKIEYKEQKGVKNGPCASPSMSYASRLCSIRFVRVPWRLSRRISEMVG